MAKKILQNAEKVVMERVLRKSKNDNILQNPIELVRDVYLY